MADLNEATENFLRALPKCEHHLHIEGTLRPARVFALAKKNNIPLPSTPPYASPEALAESYKHFVDLQSFLDPYYLAVSCLRTADDFHGMAWEYLEAAHRDGVVHLEISFDPQAHTRRGVDVAIVIEGLTSARLRAEKELGMSTRLVSCFMKDVGYAAALDTLKSVEPFVRDKKIHGIGLDSSEIGFDIKKFKDVYDLARSWGLSLTAHAGEEGPPANVRAVVEVLGTGRVDHGVTSAQDPEVLRLLKDKGTLLTVCPVSNVALRVCTVVSEVPLRTFLDAGVHFSINSDDPAYFGAGLLENYLEVQKHFGFGVEEWRWVCTSAVHGSWMEEDLKEQILAKCEQLLTQWGKSK